MGEKPFEDVIVSRTSEELVKREHSRDYVETYSNFAECGITPWDIRILFSQTSERGITKVATVVMTPAMAKSVLSLLNNNIKLYERDNGEIKMPESVKRAAEALRTKAKEAEAQAPAKRAPAKE